ncbi:MAG: hypothetical protein O2890_13885 [Cyanobacteria bacterium]|nr:hypothetical protein [Cyanobacteriota bacterium]MDA0867469.1 hypothetical protein [Cyanobacteriota bacterium]
MNTTHPTAQQRRLRTAVKRLVIELGYLECCLDEGLLDVNIHAAAVGLDSAVDRLNDYLAQDRAAQQVA